MKKIVLVVGIVLVIILTAVGISIWLGSDGEDSNSDMENGIGTSTDYYIVEDAIYEKMGDTNSNAIASNMKKINAAWENYLQNNKVAFTVIPDKTYYLENQIDTSFREIETEVANNLNPAITYFKISDVLSLEDYYRTDMHWKQENLEKVVSTILEQFNLNNEASIQAQSEIGSKEIETPTYEEKSLGEFYGTYTTEIENSVTPDELRYLTNAEIENSNVYSEESQTNQPVYNLAKAEETGNKYDVFLSGASAIETIQNENANTGKKLILFRDSFGSSLAPLLIPYYDEIVLIDLRYVNYTILENYLDFSEYENQDVLFIYSSRVINRAGILR